MRTKNDGNVETVISGDKTAFSTNHSLQLKGIAIIMMMFHHCFRLNNLFKGYKVSFFPFNQDFIVQLSLTFKICVSIFVFITGYGLTISLKKLNSKYNWTRKEICKWTVNRLVKLLSGFWIIAILSYIICQAIDGRTVNLFFKDEKLSGIVSMLINFMGLSKLFDTEFYCSTWYYMSLAILFVFSVPVFLKLFNKFKYMPVLITVVALPRIIGWKYVNSSYISFLFPLLLGIIFAEKNLIVKIANFKITKNIYINKVLKFIIETAIVIACYFLYDELTPKLFWEIRYGIIPVILICYLYEFYLNIPVIKNILGFLGKHSMNIFLIHTFFRLYYLKDFIYSQRNFMKIAGMLLLISLITSIILELFKKLIRYDKIINRLQKFLDKRIEKIFVNNSKKGAENGEQSETMV